jgi:hypothetical protein
MIHSDLSAFPLLRPTLLNLLQELPSNVTGLGAMEMRLLEMIARRYTHVNELVYLSDLGHGRIFNDFEIGCLLEGLALNSRPAVAGVDDELGFAGEEYAISHRSIPAKPCVSHRVRQGGSRVQGRLQPS